MHPRFLSRFPHLRLILLAVFTWLGIPAVAHAIPAPQIVLEDTLTVGSYMRSVHLDTTHFAGHMLLAATVAGTDSASLVLLIQPSPLAVIDTIARYPQTNAYFARAAYINSDTSLDYAVAIGSGWWGLEIRYGPDYTVTDTLTFPRPLRDVVIDDSSHEAWIGYFHDTTYVYAPGTPDESDVLETLGALIHYDSLMGTVTFLSSDFAGLELHLVDVNNSGQTQLVAFWSDHWYVYPKYYSGPAPNPEWKHVGVRMYDPSGTLLAHDTLRAEGSRDAEGPDFPPALGFHLPVPIADLTGDGSPDLVFSSAGQWMSYPPYTQRLEALSLQTGTPLWPAREFSEGGPGAWPVCLWPLDDDSLSDILLADSYPLTLRAYKGNTGESLFVMPTDFYFDPVATGYLDNSGVWKGILKVEDTIFLVRLDPPTGVHDDGGIQPDAFALYPNYPNPFNAATEIEYSLSAPGRVRLDIFNVLGQHVRALVDEPLPAGKHRVTWDATDDNNHAVASGVYFYRLRVDDHVKTRKLVLLK